MCERTFHLKLAGEAPSGSRCCAKPEKRAVWKEEENMQPEPEYLIGKYQNNLYLAAYSVLQNPADAQDAVQMTFIKYLQQNTDFEDEEHVRKWLFRTVFNQAKDIRRSLFRRRSVPIDAIAEQPAAMESQADRDLFEAVSALPAKERSVLQLYYYENYSTREIAELLSLSEAAVRKRLSRARNLLREKLKGDWENEPE